MASNINYKAVVLYSVVIAALVVAALYFLYPPVTHMINTAGAWITTNLSALMASLNLGDIDIAKLISDNIGAIVGVAGAGITALITYAKYRSVSATNDELVKQQKLLTGEKLNLESNVEGLTTTVADQAEKLKVYAEDETAGVLQARLSEMQRGYEQQITYLQAQVTKLQKDLDSRPVIQVTKEVVK